MKRLIHISAAALLVFCTMQAVAEHYLANTIWFGGAKTPNWSRISKYVEVCKERGCTSISFDISWTIERRDGQYDFALADRLADEITSRGMTVFIRMNTSLLGGERPKWITEKMLMQTPNGRVYNRRGAEAIPAITHRVVQRKMESFYTAVSSHFASRNRRLGHPPVVCYSAAFDLYMESEYFPGPDLDYSPSSQEAFLAWLGGITNRADIKDLNKQWGTKYDALRDVTLLKAPPALKERFFARTLDECFTRLSRALKAGDQNAKFGVQFGCLWDNPRRHSMLADLRNPAVDWVFVADAPAYPHAFTTDMLRASARGKQISNEIDGPIPKMTDDVAFEQGRISFAHGADAVFICNWPLEKFSDRAAWTFPDRLGKVAREQGKEGKEIKPKRALYVSTWDLINLTARPAAYQAAYDKLTDNGQKTIDILNDGAILADAKKLADYDEIVLPINITIPADVRRVLEQLPRGELKILQPDKAGILDEFGKMMMPLGK